MPDPGRLILVVGPSGAGKDTLLDAARDHYSDNPEFVFARRMITRPEAAGGEDHIAISDTEFDKCRDDGDFCLHWEAHGLKYGIPQEYEQLRRNGINIVASVSRQVIEQAYTSFSRVMTIVVTASNEALAARLAARGRETSAEIALRLRRQVPELQHCETLLIVDNSGSLDEGIQAFLKALQTPNASHIKGSELKHSQTETAAEA